jgi:hypothetical protein
MIPDDLKAFPHWVVWRYVIKDGKKTKVPFNARSGALADPTNINDLSTFDLATYALENQEYDGRGFVFNDENPFSGIDLDNPFKRDDHTIITEHDSDYAEAIAIVESHKRIIAEFSSFTEWSPSGMGAHIFVRGKLPYGIHQGRIEVYSRDRFFTVTGNTHNLDVHPVQDRSGALTIFAEALGGGRGSDAAVFDREALESDEAVYNRCASGANAELFNRLWNGKDDTGYFSGSEADQALTNIIANSTDNLEQCMRVFCHSPRYKFERIKLHKRDDLIKRNARKAFDLKAPPIDFSALSKDVKQFVQAKPTEHYSNPYAHLMGQKVPGLLGEIAEYFWWNAPRQIVEVQLAASFALMAGICGRSYNIGSLGLAQYIVLLAESGTGKEAMSASISTLMASVRETVPAADEFIGPSYIASAQAIAKELPKRPSFIAVFAEFGVVINIMLDTRGNANNQQQRAMYLDLYGKNGGKNQLGRSIYSDNEKNTKTVRSPALTKLGESVPGLFYEALNDKTISEGYFPRLLIIEYKGPAVEYNPHAGMHAPKKELVEALAQLCALSLQTNQQINGGQDAIQVKLDYETAALRTQLDSFCVKMQNECASTSARALWARVLVKTLKLAGIRAVGINWHNPTITRADFEWALAFTLSDVYRILARLDTGEVETANVDNDRSAAVMHVLRRYFSFTDDQLKGYGVDKRLFDAKVIPLSYLQRSLSTRAAFKTAVRTERTRSVNDTLAEFVKNDMLREVPPADVERINGSRAKCYVLGKAMPET